LYEKKRNLLNNIKHKKKRHLEKYLLGISCQTHDGHSIGLRQEVREWKFMIRKWHPYNEGYVGYEIRSIVDSWHMQSESVTIWSWILIDKHHILFPIDT